MTIYEKIKQIITQILGIDPIYVTDNAQLVGDLGADSLDMEEIVLSVATFFEIAIPPEAAEKFRTIIDIFDFVRDAKVAPINLKPVIIYPEKGKPNPFDIPNPYPWLWPSTYVYPDPNADNNPFYNPPQSSVTERDKKIAKGLLWALEKVKQKIKYDQQTSLELRTGSTPEALAKMDCSEMVCRYLKEIGLTPTVLAKNTWAMKTWVQGSDFTAVAIPQPGDIYLWNVSQTKGHVGIVRSYDASTGMVTYLHETRYGDIDFASQGSAHIDGKVFKNHAGWTGFYRPGIN